MSVARPRAHGLKLWAVAVLLCAVAGGKVLLCMSMRSPVFVDEIAYADLAHEIAVHNRWVVCYPLPQSFPPWYSAVLSPWFLLLGQIGMEGVYRACLLTNVVLALCGSAAVAALRWWRTWQQRLWVMAVVLLWPALSAYQHVLLSENVCIPLYLLTLLCLAMTARSAEGDTNTGWRGWRSACGLGVVLGVMYGVRPLTALAAMVSAVLALCAMRWWRTLLVTALGSALATCVVMVPEYAWGKGTLFHYAGREQGLLNAGVRALREMDTLILLLQRIGYAMLYLVLATLVVVWAGIICSYRRMPLSWRVTLWYCVGGAGLMAVGSALHTMTSTHSVWIPRYLDPFVMGLTVVGLAGVARMRRADRAHALTLVVAGCLLLTWVPLRHDWWMNSLAVAYVRLVAGIHRWAVWCGWCLLAGAIVAVCHVCASARQRATAALLMLALLCVLNYLNAEEYGRHSRMLGRLSDRCKRQIGTRRELSLYQLATELNVKHRSDIVLMRQCVYFWTMGENILKLEPAGHECVHEK